MLKLDYQNTRPATIFHEDLDLSTMKRLKIRQINCVSCNLSI